MNKQSRVEESRQVPREAALQFIYILTTLPTQLRTAGTGGRGGNGTTATAAQGAADAHVRPGRPGEQRHCRAVEFALPPRRPPVMRCLPSPICPVELSLPGYGETYQFYSV